MLRAPAAALQAPAVFVVIPAYGRPALLARALASLVDHTAALRGAIIVNNSRDAETARVAASAAVPCSVVTPAVNLGTAGGLAAGLRVLLGDPSATHAWILDDDAVATPGALEAMLQAMARAGADAAMPLLTDEADRVRWLPCPLRRRDRAFVRRGPTSREIVERLGPEPRRWNWAIWASLLVTRRAIDAAGLPRIELWSQFSDIEYTLRLTEKFAGVLVPRAVCRHLPPESAGAGFDAKLYSALQNGNYVTVRLPHGRRALRHLPGQSVRYLRHYRWTPRAWWNVCTAFAKGALLGRPAPLPADRRELERAAESAPLSVAGQPA